MTIPSSIRDNQKRGTVGEYLADQLTDTSKLNIVSAYFTIHAYNALKDKLDNIKELNFLFGEPRFVKALDPDKSTHKSFRIENEEIQIANKLQQSKIAKDCAEWIRNKVDIRSIKQANLMHGKMYHIDNNGIEQAIVGSSNFTLKGLGLTKQSNIELNLVVDSNRDRNDLKAWFFDIWNNPELVEDVKSEVLQYLEQLYVDQQPEFLYFKTLYHIFEKFLEDQTKGGLLTEKHLLTETEIWKTLFEFQKDAVKGAINKILKHQGCIIADSVGLGKTYEALAVIKYFELLNARVMVLCPKKLKENWTIYQAHTGSKLNPFTQDRYAYTVLCHTDLSRENGKSGDIDLAQFNWGAFDLVVIDESHNFRNNTKGKRDDEGNIVRLSRYERLMQDIIKKGGKTKVLMLSATPVNNTLSDLRNQIAFITEDVDNAFSDPESMGIQSISETLRVAQQMFINWTKQRIKEKKTSRDLLADLDSAFFKLLDELTIARSRKHILRYYKDEISKIGGFPKRLKPDSRYSEIDLTGRFLSYDKLNEEIEQYALSLFNPSRYVKDKFIKYYEQKARTSGFIQFTQRDRESFLIGMMKINFMKRLESSIESFEITMDRTIKKIEGLEAKIANFQQIRKDPDFDISNLEIDALDDEDLKDALEVGKKLTFNLDHLELDKWLIDLKKDKDQLSVLYNAAVSVTPEKDAKLKDLKQLIENKVKNPTLNNYGKPNKKVLIFTAFADTAQYLYDQIKDWALRNLKVHIALVTGGSGNSRSTFMPKGYKGQSEYGSILTNFSPIAKRRNQIQSMPQDGEIDILIATDCISEGQNLQDCDYLINYDIHWNPVRIIQRFGRIDRIGSHNPEVQLVNFWPTKDLDHYIKLKHRVEARMALVDITATAEDNILKPDEIKNLVTDNLKYRDKQLLRLKDEILDLEDFNESVNLSDFTLDDFRIELANYIDANKDLLENAPLGLYAVVPHAIGQTSLFEQGVADIIQPGVIFCLKQKGSTEGNEKVNPLQPYFLVYIRDDRVVRFTFTHPKQILEIYRMLCIGKTKPLEELCRKFDRETLNGGDMKTYNNLLKLAIKSIAKTFSRRVVNQLFTNRGATIPTNDNNVTDDTDFELITWLVIK